MITDEQWELIHKVETLSEEYGQDPNLVLRIMKCESGLDKDAIGYNKNKEGVVWSEDISYWQINTYYHEASALEMGLNIHNPEDNLRYGMVLMSKEGTQPWEASEKCWSV